MIGLSLKYDIPLNKLSTFGIGGKARLCAEIHTIVEMAMVLTYCYHRQLPFIVIGKGSNCLFDDKGWDGLVILNKIDFINYLSEDIIEVGAGYSFSLLGTQTARKQLSGLEFASGIPGSVGGAVFMNAGANKSETAETLVSVDYITELGDKITLQKKDITFDYRYSSFQTMQGAIVSATFKLTHSSDARQKQLDIIEYRKKTQPLNEKSAGCVFRNPSCGFAGALIEECGLKNFQIGGAKVSPVHANFIINTGNGTAEDVKSLISVIKQTVKDKKNIALESEIRTIPYQ